MNRFGQRQGFLVSAIIHLALLMVLISHAPGTDRLASETGQALEQTDKIFMPTAAELRKLIPAQPRSAASRPAPASPPAPEAEKLKQKDRISVGPPVAVRQQGPMILRREDDLTKVPKGRADAVPSPDEKAPVAAATPIPATAPEPPRSAATPDRAGLRMPPGVGRGDLPRAVTGSRSPGPMQPGSLAASIDRSIAKQMERTGPIGLPSGTGQQVGPFNFDPEGADFTVWINHGKNEIYRNWIMPQSVMLGFSGAVTFEFTVERDGRMSAIQMVKSSGTPALDRAARNGLTGARWLPLPSDFGPAQLTLRVTFIYGNAPQDL